MGKRVKTKGKYKPLENNNTPKKPVEPKTNQKTPVQEVPKPISKSENNNNTKEIDKAPILIDDDGEEAEWCRHLDQSNPFEFCNLIKKQLRCGCYRRAIVSCIHRDCIKRYSASACKNFKHQFPHITRHNHPAFLHHPLKVLICTKCNIRCSLGRFLKHFNVPDNYTPPKEKTEFRRKGMIGYVNFGNTCYMNAVLQLLGHCPSFAEYLIRLEPPGGWERCPIDIPKTVIQMAIDMRVMYSSIKLPFASPWKIISCVRNEMPGFECFQQQDASEFLRNLLDILDRDLKACSEYHKRKMPIGLGNPDVDYDIATLSEKTKTVVSALFQGVLQNEIRCHSCGYRSVTTENFLDLSIPIVSEDEYEGVFLGSPKKKVRPVAQDPEFTKESTSKEDGQDPGFLVNVGVAHKTSLDECLDRFFENSTLDGDNQYSCSRCNTLVDATKTTKAKHLPEYILIQLKRFRHTIYGSSKIGKVVEFPLRVQNFGEWTTSKEPALYELIGFVVHEGRSVEYGHYVTFCKHEIDGQWYKFDDIQVSRFDVTKVAKTDPYIMMFRKIDSNTVNVMRKKHVSPFNFYGSKVFFNDRYEELWATIGRYLKRVPQNKPKKVITARKLTTCETKASSEKKRARKRFSERKTAEILSRCDIPLNKVRQHIANMEKILEDLQLSMASMPKNRRLNRASREQTLEAATKLVDSLENWFKMIIAKETLAEQPPRIIMKPKKSKKPEKSKTD
uniref:Ubiquitin carboxyl-terminal hydrolase n=1 Tax=Caenorhabditis tropicalis TaxID=1561998 RepID=A0A1I7TRX1_9PELO